MLELIAKPSILDPPHGPSIFWEGIGYLHSSFEADSQTHVSFIITERRFGLTPASGSRDFRTIKMKPSYCNSLSGHRRALHSCNGGNCPRTVHCTPLQVTTHPTRDMIT